MGGQFNTDIVEAVIIGAGVTTVICSINDLTSSVGLIIVYMLALFIQLTWREATEEISYCYDLILRPSSSSGILLGSVLLPLVIISTQSSQYNSSSIHLTDDDGNNLAASCLVFSIACLLCVWLTRCKMSVTVLERLISVRWVVSWVAVMVILHKVPLQGVVALAVSFGGSVTCVWFLLGLLYVLEESFTIGEAMVVAQGLTLLTLEAVNTTVYHTGRELIACLQVLILGGIIIGLTMKPVLQKMPTIYSINVSRGKHKQQGNGANHSNRIQDIPRPFSWKLTAFFYIAIAASIICILLPWLGIMIKSWPLLFGLKFTLMTSEKRTCLVFIWAGLISTAITMVFWLQTSSTVTRKYFHLFTVAAFLPGIYFDVELVFLATAGTFFIAILLEFFRIHQVWPLGEALQSASQTLGDAQDTGVIFLSHLYLLLGLAVPVWLYTGVHGYHIESTLPLFSGVLSVGIGDTAASVIGSKYGVIKWPGTKKTILGTVSAILFQIPACYLLSYIGILPSMASHFFSISWAIVLTSLLEAFTLQIDNLVLPLFMYCLLVT
ncbi:dolichol kinase-like [Amphiura filiformis]|uniref:dolichol kinase-like n=1 Tax=Amphiura filiformis TaxID=82378 RepID=UPI003B210B79